MFNAITHSSIYVLDQDEALDFYVNKLGLEVNTDFDMGFMRWLTVNVPGEPRRQILLEKPGPPAIDEAAAEQVRELLTKGSMGLGFILTMEDCQRTYEELLARGRRVHPAAGRAVLRHRLRAARPVRQTTSGSRSRRPSRSRCPTPRSPPTADPTSLHYAQPQMGDAVGHRFSGFVRVDVPRRRCRSCPLLDRGARASSPDRRPTHGVVHRPRPGPLHVIVRPDDEAVR